MSEQSAFAGIPVWHEIVTGEGEKAAKFYTDLLVWDSKQEDMGPAGTYTMFVSGEHMHGGIEKKDGVPSHWITYFAVDDVDAAAETAEAAGGKILVPGTDIPNVGRFCMVQDPQGGISCPFKGRQEMTAENSQPAPAGFCWEELMTTDAEAAIAFYQKLYGWTHEAMDMGEGGTYHIMKSGERGCVGIMQMPAEAAGSPTHWIPYIAVDNVDDTAGKAERLGAKVYVPPRDIPGMGRFSVVADTVGASVAFYQEAKK